MSGKEYCFFVVVVVLCGGKIDFFFIEFVKFLTIYNFEFSLFISIALFAITFCVMHKSRFFIFN